MPVEHKPLTSVPAVVLARFWSHFIIAAPNECWEWTSHINTNGYGQIRLTHQGKTEAWIASRLAYYIGYGIDPGPLMTCHKCDNRRCVNWNHLFLGTNSDNVQDCIRKGRYKQPTKCPLSKHARGEQVGTSLVNADTVREIRRRHAAGNITFRQLGEQFGVTLHCIWSIVKRVNWRHI